MTLHYYMVLYFYDTAGVQYPVLSTVLYTVVGGQPPSPLLQKRVRAGRNRSLSIAVCVVVGGGFSQVRHVRAGRNWSLSIAVCGGGGGASAR